MKKVFVHTNNKQILGFHLAKYAIERKNDKIPVEMINVDDLQIFKDFHNSTYKFNTTEERTYDKEDLQSFTLSRFMPPELMNYEGKAVVIDPDIFPLVDIDELFNLDMKGSAIVACKKKDAWDSSVMLLDCSKLKHWNVGKWLEMLKNKEIDYTTIMTLSQEKSVTELPRMWNDLDKLDKETKLLHTTGRLTQPWRTGLPIDFTRNRMPKLFGIIPREPIHKILGKYPTHYQPHPDKNIEKWFLSLVSDALRDGAISKELVEEEVKKKHVRPDIFEILSN